MNQTSRQLKIKAELLHLEEVLGFLEEALEEAGLDPFDFDMY